MPACCSFAAPATSPSPRPVRPTHDNLQNVPDSIAIYDINGPLFFGSAHKALHSLTEVTPQVRVVILDMSEVSVLDMSALVAMESIVENLGKRGVGLVINNLQPRMLLKLRRAGIRRRQGSILFSRDLHEAIEKGRELADPMMQDRPALRRSSCERAYVCRTP